MLNDIRLSPSKIRRKSEYGSRIRERYLIRHKGSTQEEQEQRGIAWKKILSVRIPMGERNVKQAWKSFGEKNMKKILKEAKRSLRKTELPLNKVQIPELPNNSYMFKKTRNFKIKDRISKRKNAWKMMNTNRKLLKLKKQDQMFRRTKSGQQYSFRNRRVNDRIVSRK